jgi:large subunit ribosomal protein L10
VQVKTMNREEKSATIDEIAAQIEAAEAIFAVHYRGISVSQAAELRGKLREADASFRVVKNRLTRLAAERAGEERLGELLEGPVALTFVRGDTAMAAKAITTFNKEHEVLVFRGGFMDGISLDEERFKSIARLPSREVLNGQFAGVVASPLTGLVRGLGSMIQGLALQLGQIAEKGLVSGEAPAAPAEEPDEVEGEAEQGEASPPAADAERSTPAESDGEADSPSEEQPQSDSSATSEGGEAPDTSEEDKDGGPADAPVEEPPTESGAEAEPPAEEPSQAEGDEGDAEPAGDETSSDEETSEDDENQEEE